MQARLHRALWAFGHRSIQVCRILYVLLAGPSISLRKLASYVEIASGELGFVFLLESTRQLNCPSP